jgi:hypothetical protein
MSHAIEAAVIMGLLAALLSRLPSPYVSSVWGMIVFGSLALWYIALVTMPTLVEGFVVGLLLQLAFSIVFVATASGLEHAAGLLNGRRSRA